MSGENVERAKYKYEFITDSIRDLYLVKEKLLELALKIDGKKEKDNEQDIINYPRQDIINYPSLVSFLDNASGDMDNILKDMMDIITHIDNQLFH